MGKLIEIDIPTGAPNPFAPEIAELLAASNENPKSAMEWIVATEDLQKTKYKLATAARDVKRTASLVIEEQGKKEGTVRLVYRLKPMVRSTTREEREAAKLAGSAPESIDTESPIAE